MSEDRTNPDDNQQLAAKAPSAGQVTVSLPNDLIATFAGEVQSGVELPMALANFVARLLGRGMGVSFGPPPRASPLMLASQLPPVPPAGKFPLRRI